MADAVNYVSQNTGSWHWLLSFSGSHYVPTSAHVLCLPLWASSLLFFFCSFKLCLRRAKELKGLSDHGPAVYGHFKTEAWEGTLTKVMQQRAAELRGDSLLTLLATASCAWTNVGNLVFPSETQLFNRAISFLLFYHDLL